MIVFEEGGVVSNTTTSYRERDIHMDRCDLQRQRRNRHQKRKKTIILSPDKWTVTAIF